MCVALRVLKVGKKVHKGISDSDNLKYYYPGEMLAWQARGR